MTDPATIAASLTEAQKRGLDALGKASPGPVLDQCLLDLGALKREGNRLVRTPIGNRMLQMIAERERSQHD